jgi:hypothetical protein
MHFQFTFAHALGFSAFTSRLLATGLNTEGSTSNSYEVFLPFLLQSLCTFGTQLKIRLLLTSPDYDCPKTTFVIPYKPSARTYRKCHVVAMQPVYWRAGWTYRKHITWPLPTVVWRHRLCRIVFSESLPRNGLYNSVVLVLRACII